MTEPAVDTAEPTNERASVVAQGVVLGILVLVGALALTAIVLVAHARLSTTTATDGQDMSLLNRGLIGSGFGSTSPTQTALGQGPVADIAAALVAKSFSFTPDKFDQQVAAAKQLMTAGMQQQYTQQLATQQTQKAVRLGLTVKTTLVHLNNDPSKIAFIGVTSLTATSGEFLIYMQRAVTRTGSSQEQVTQFVLDVTVARIGNSWMLSSVQTI